MALDVGLNYYSSEHYKEEANQMPYTKLICYPLHNECIYGSIRNVMEVII